jgi:hypothetical protein
MYIHQHNKYYRREALHYWKRRNGLKATYSKLKMIFERADCKEYADGVRKIVELSNNKTDDSSEEQSQPQVYPASKPHSLSQVPPAMHKPTEVYEVREGTPPEGKFANYSIYEY